jgi:internalin A
MKSTVWRSGGSRGGVVLVVVVEEVVVVVEEVVVVVEEVVGEVLVVGGEVVVVGGVLVVVGAVVDGLVTVAAVVWGAVVCGAAVVGAGATAPAVVVGPGAVGAVSGGGQGLAAAAGSEPTNAEGTRIAAASTSIRTTRRRPRITATAPVASMIAATATMRPSVLPVAGNVGQLRSITVPRRNPVELDVDESEGSEVGRRCRRRRSADRSAPEAATAMTIGG